MRSNTRLRDDTGRRLHCQEHLSSAVAFVRIVRRDLSVRREILACDRCLQRFRRAWGPLPTNSYALFGTSAPAHLRTLERFFVSELKLRGIQVRDTLADMRRDENIARVDAARRRRAAGV